MKKLLLTLTLLLTITASFFNTCLANEPMEKQGILPIEEMFPITPESDGKEYYISLKEFPNGIEIFGEWMKGFSEDSLNLSLPVNEINICEIEGGKEHLTVIPNQLGVMQFTVSNGNHYDAAKPNYCQATIKIYVIE